MSYWGNRPIDNDFAFDQIGSYIYLIKERMFQSVDVVIDKPHPEQSMIASLQCIRLLAQEFPKCVSVSFGRSEFEETKAAFEKWYDAVYKKIPAKYREAVLEAANTEFALFEERVLIKKNG
ncbi:hypothetical protein [Gimesia aquarii]|uniref:Uncharacterized protein n=1 Tax=Gimesia aquarii TaxID=2527964 RepID=A0A517WSG3_9PLAN|nr:hypothetical protein [Gimesia aquarii]QDU08168.1 hypothetical protein V202x_15320 [Gimesia aquarii]